MIAYGEDESNPITNNLLIAQNTFINDGNGQFLDNIQKVSAIIKQNIFIGPNAPLISDNQIALYDDLENPVLYNYQILKAHQGKVNYASYRYLNNASFESRTDSVYGAYYSTKAINAHK